MSEAKTNIDRFIAANMSVHEELENLVNIFDNSLIFSGGINKNSVQIYSGIDKLAKEIGVETKEILYDGEQPRKVFEYKGMEFFQLGEIDYKSVKVFSEKEIASIISNHYPITEEDCVILLKNILEGYMLPGSMSLQDKTIRLFKLERGIKKAISLMLCGETEAAERVLTRVLVEYK
jgi:hypothetical protein